VDDTMNDPRIGTEIGGYLIEALIGQGGMGVVYRARDLQLGRRVALKLLAPELAENDGFRVRFENESRLAAAIDHPHIIPLYESAEVDGLLFLTMRYVEGVDLKGLLERERRLPMERALTIAAQVAGALDAAHRQALVHRDVKPANVLIDSNSGEHASEHCYLTDFGLTRDTSQNTRLTVTGQFVGTTDYVAPEQIDGGPQGPATDQYALACVLFECLAGHPPFARQTELEVLWAHLSDDPPRVTADRPDLPAGLDGVLRQALAKHPADRHATCAALIAAARATTTKPAAATVPSPVRGARGGHASPARGARTTRPSPTPAPGGDPQPLTAPREAFPRAPAPAEVPRSRAGRIGRAVAAIVLVVAAAIAGVVVAHAGDDSGSPATNVAATSGISLRFPAQWQALSSPPPIPGLRFGDRVAVGPPAAAGRAGLVAGRIASSGASLLPAALAPAARPPDVVRLGPVEALRYAGLRPAGFVGSVTVYVVLTDAGRTAIACYGASPAARFDARCADVVASLELTAGRALTVTPSPRYAKAASEALARVAGDRAAGGRRLRAARTPSGQARAAAAVAAGYARAARRIDALSAPAAVDRVNAAIAAALRDIGHGFATASQAARGRAAARYAAPRKAIGRGDDALRTAVGSLAQFGYAIAS
jgi:protein kinase-like protein